ncbi:unnamed protein product [Ixodes persulcatus]
MAVDFAFFVKDVPGFPHDVKVTFTSKPDDNLLCGTCQSITQKGCADPKGHLFCNECSLVFTDVGGNFTCPTCNWQGKRKEMLQSNPSWAKVSGLYAYCPMENNTCQYKGKLRDTIVHYQQCSDPSRASCPFCKNRYLKKELGGHIRDGCPSRIVQCRHCRVDMEDHLRQKHEKTCDMRPATCEYCKANLKTFAELRDHHLDRCLQKTRKCVFADFGCPFQGIWQQIQQHMAVSNNHTDVLVKRVIELTRDVQELQRQLGVQSLATTTMDEKFSRQLNEVEGKLECVTNNMAIHSADLQAQKQVQSTQKGVFERLFEEGEKANQSFRAEVLEKFSEVPTEFTHVWKIQPYTHLRDATAVSSTKRLSSGKIYTGTPGYCIEFLVDLNGAVAGSTATHVGAMFKIHSGEYDNLMPWPFYSRIVLTLKNHLYPDKNVQFQIVPRDSSPELLECFARPQPGLSSKVFGISKVISTPLLENESKGFLLGNCIVLTFAIYPDLDL